MPLGHANDKLCKVKSIHNWVNLIPKMYGKCEYLNTSHTMEIVDEMKTN
jgi:hypothetical protein